MIFDLNLPNYSNLGNREAMIAIAECGEDRYAEVGNPSARDRGFLEPPGTTRKATQPTSG